MADQLPNVPELLQTAVRSLGGAERTSQLTMASAVAHSIDTGEHLAVQAGTGTGKSLAYLVPSLRHAVESGRTVVVSTATIALQRQLVDRDLPRLADALKKPLGRRAEFAILKGRNNYLCMNKIHTGASEQPPEDELFDPFTVSRLGREVVRLTEWSSDTETGDRDELVPGVSDQAWRQVSVTSRECIGKIRCPVGEDCFAERARVEASKADVVVTNHALLAIDAITGIQILPDHDVVVIDEAHELVDRVTGVATADLTASSISAAARRCGKIAEEQDADRLEAAGEGWAATPRGIASRSMGRPPGRCGARTGGDTRRGLVAAHRDRSGQTGHGSRRPRSRCSPQRCALVRRRRPRQCRAYSHRFRRTRPGQAQGRRLAVLGRVPRIGPALRPDGSALRRRIAALATVRRIHRRSHLRDADRRRIVRRSRRQLGPSCRNRRCAPTRVPPSAPKHLLTLLLSAGTHSTSGRPSTMPRPASSTLPRHLPTPGRDGLSPVYLDEIAELVEAAGGRTLGLFSSMRAAKAASEAMRERLDTPILCQGDDATGTLVKAFAKDEPTSLFGTLSLWQGVDVPGPSLSLVILDRIPFPRPDDPLLVARQQAIESHGGNGFLSVSANHAALLLAQGVGRLLRSTDDKGVVAVLDPRLATARYAGYLRASLPPFWETTNPEVVRKALTRIRDSRP